MPNRIARGRFVLEGREYQLAINDGPNHLHGGLKGFDKVIWSAKPFSQSLAAGVRFSYLSPDGEEGYPGNLSCQVTYLLTDHNQLEISYRATTDRLTHLNLTNHSYFNLSGGSKDNILDHELQIIASAYTPVDANLIPTGEIKTVAGTPFDFRQTVRIGERISQVRGGYDHNYVLDNRGQMTLAARVFEESSGRILELLTTEPGLQFYSGNFLDGKLKAKETGPMGPGLLSVLKPSIFPIHPTSRISPQLFSSPGRFIKVKPFSDS